METHLQRDFNRARSVVGVEHTRQSWRRDTQQFLGQPDCRLVGEAGEDDMFEPVELILDRRGDTRIGMAEQVGPP